MPLETYPLEDLRTLAKRNPDYRWPTRSKANRLEPVCRPRFDPSFQINRDDRIFTIGSCFAGYIGGHMRDAGFDVHPVDVQTRAPKKFRTTDLLYRHSPFSILQTFQWGLEPDTLPAHCECYIETADGEIYDPTLAHHAAGSLAEIEEINQKVSEGDRAIKDCRVVIITLGLIETVFDLKTNLYLEAWPGNLVQPGDRERYEVRILSVAEILEALEEIHAILARNLEEGFKILLTVSPVPLNNSLRDCDVISANMYSKSSLRTAAEEFFLTHENVDYLPAYESVTLSERLAAWDADLRHPTRFIVRLNMARMLSRYVPDEAFKVEEEEIDAEVADFEQQFIKDWPKQLRVFQSYFTSLEDRLATHVEKPETLRRLMETEIAGLNATVERLQESNARYLRQLLEQGGGG